MSPSTARTPSVPVEPQFVQRWSPRSFERRPVPDADLAALFEAARWAPSCFNEQPWLFVWGRASEDHERIAGLLVEGNRAWAAAAPVLGVVFARRTFRRNGNPNRWAAFDTGAAAMSLALEAHARGLATHFMGGFDAERAAEELSVPAGEYEALAAFAVGHPGEASALPEALRERERPSDRKAPEEVAVEGRLTE